MLIKENAVNSFEKDFFKLLNNSVYWKAMRNLRKRLKVRFANNAKDYKIGWVSFISHKIFGKNFVALHKIKPLLHNAW